QKHLQDEQAAYDWVEARLWPNGPVCPHCGETKRVGKMNGKTTRIGLYKCYQPKCLKPFNVKVGSIFEKSHVPMRIWLQAFTLMCGSKKGVSSHSYIGPWASPSKARGFSASASVKPCARVPSCLQWAAVAVSSRSMTPRLDARRVFPRATA